MSDDPATTFFLLVEDDDAHAELVSVLVNTVEESVRLHRVRDGVEAIDYLKQLVSSNNPHRPDVILLDLKLPRMDGHQVLERIKLDPELCTIPVVVLTTSNNESDRQRAYELHANSFVSKPLDFQSIQQMIRNLTQYWCMWNQPPHQGSDRTTTGQTRTAESP